MTMVDLNKPLENGKLKELFVRRTRAQSQEEYTLVMNALAEEIVMNARFLSVVQFSAEPEQQPDGRSIFQKDTTMSFSMLTSQEGKDFYPVFIDWEEIGKWKSIQETQPQTLQLTFDDYAEMIVRKGTGAGIVVDPFSHNLVLERDTLAQWWEMKQAVISGSRKTTFEKGAFVRLGDPKNVPQALLDAISAFAGQEPAIRALWLRMMEKDGEISHLVVVDFDGDQDTLFQGIAAAGRSYMNGICLDLVPYSDESWQNAVAEVSPFYEKRVARPAPLA